MGSLFKKCRKMSSFSFFFSIWTCFSFINPFLDFMLPFLKENHNPYLHVLEQAGYHFLSIKAFNEQLFWLKFLRMISHYIQLNVLMNDGN